MGYAVQLYFNTELEAALLEVRAALTRAGVTPTLERLGDRPHVSLSVLHEVDVRSCITMLEHFADGRSSFRSGFEAFGAFPTSQGVVFLSPTPSEDLLGAHRVMHQRMVDLGAQVHEHYVPDGWIPHATMGFELSSKEVALALSWLHANFKPVDGAYASVGLIEFPPVKSLATFTLRAPAGAGAPGPKSVR